MNKKLIIWDFDGVVADTEKLWLDVELSVFNRYCGLNWDFKTINYYLAGQAFSHQLEVLAGLGIFPPKEAMTEIYEKCYALIKSGFERTKDIDDVLALTAYDHAMGTGGDINETVLKIRAVGLQDVFTPENVVTIDFVKHGKPAPDTFLLAAEIMGYKPQDCYVVEDSIAGLKAAISAEMTPVCFAGSVMYKDNAEHLKAVRALDVSNIFFSMKEVCTYFRQQAKL